MLVCHERVSVVSNEATPQNLPASCSPKARQISPGRKKGRPQPCPQIFILVEGQLSAAVGPVPVGEAVAMNT